MASNDIQVIQTTDILASSVGKINSNFRSLKDAISGNNSGLSEIYKKFDDKLTDLETGFNNKIAGEVTAKLDDIEDRITTLENSIKSINEVLDSLGVNSD